MPVGPDLSAVAALVGDPTRAAMLTALMDGRAHTATELAIEGGVTAPTATSHLARLTRGGLVTPTRQGRHRYFRIASPQVAAALEGLMRVAPRRHPAPPPGPADAALRRARVCYDHLAGEAGVRLLERLRGRGVVVGDGDDLRLGEAGLAWCRRVGIDGAGLLAGRRRPCRPCLDWSERRAHLAGALGAALLDRLFTLRLARRERGSRAVLLTSAGERFLERLELPR